MQGKHAHLLKEILQINPVERLSDADKDEALIAYDQLIDVIKQASRKGASSEALSAGIRKLGPFSTRLALSTDALTDDLELNAAIGRPAPGSGKSGS
ncbi:hypothetical protein LQG66_04235 [Bradyrhizobium ontarionense]|uniref:Transposase n=1 Tax=Bradyrhizobium ontarionense TaxID=2898149 RepID=A0ABY3RFT5_9BRAD|nr:hypothetical protein [Bradyrhizobium sp. A19]UFZ05534.1 hypothetical protein LQG66_04235 [Bradyrhizobium sp. A19]